MEHQVASVGGHDLWFVEVPGQFSFRLFQVKLDEGIWVIEIVYPKGFVGQTHRHTGPVWAQTMAGRWQYREYGVVYDAGSFVYEPAGSTHTLESLDDATRVWFLAVGANLNVDATGRVVSITDAASALDAYRALCAQQGSECNTMLT